MKLALIQFDIVWQDKEQNFLKVEKLITNKKGYDLIVLPEMFNTGFSINPLLAEEKGGKTEKFLSSLASSLKTAILAGYMIKKNGKCRNVATLFSKEGKIIASYSKVHLFSPLNEDKILESGDSPIIFQINNIPCSVFICYDLRFPEIFRSVAKEVYVMFIIANWPSSRADHWRTLLKARAIENQAYVVGLNRTGSDGNGIQYMGNSLVYDPWGKEIISSNEKEQIIECNLDIEHVRTIREKYPFLNDLKVKVKPFC